MPCFWEFTKKEREPHKIRLPFKFEFYTRYSTVTDFAKLRGWSTLHSLITAI